MISILALACVPVLVGVWLLERRDRRQQRALIDQMTRQYRAACGEDPDSPIFEDDEPGG